MVTNSIMMSAIQHLENIKVRQHKADEHSWYEQNQGHPGKMLSSVLMDIEGSGHITVFRMCTGHEEFVAISLF